jgi:hypothetical protein
VIGCQTGAVACVIDHERDGLLVPYQNPAALTDALVRLLENPELGRSMGAAGRRKVLREHGWPAVAGVSATSTCGRSTREPAPSTRPGDDPQAMLSLLVGSALLAGAAFRIWTRIPPDGSRQPLDLLEATFLTAATGLIVIGWSATALASLGWFSATAVGLAAGVTSGVLLGASRDRGSRASLALGGRPEAGLLAVLALSALAYARPHEYVLGGADAGTYMNVAAAIARTGELVVHDDWVRMLAEHGDVSLRPSPKHLRTRQIQFVGWYVDDADASRVLPQFLPLHPALTAVAIAAGGLRAGLYVPPVCALLGLAGVFLVARRLFGPGVGLLAAAVLGATPSQTFFARYPTAEPVSMALVFTGLLAYQHLRDGEQRSQAFGLVGGAAFGVRGADQDRSADRPRPGGGRAPRRAARRNLGPRLDGLHGRAARPPLPCGSAPLAALLAVRVERVRGTGAGDRAHRGASLDGDRDRADDRDRCGRASRARASAEWSRRARGTRLAARPRRPSPHWSSSPARTPTFSARTSNPAEPPRPGPRGPSTRSSTPRIGSASAGT